MHTFWSKPLTGVFPWLLSVSTLTLLKKNMPTAWSCHRHMALCTVQFSAVLDRSLAVNGIVMEKCDRSSNSLMSILIAKSSLCNWPKKVHPKEWHKKRQRQYQLLATTETTRNDLWINKEAEMIGLWQQRQGIGHFLVATFGICFSAPYACGVGMSCWSETSCSNLRRPKKAKSESIFRVI